MAETVNHPLVVAVAFGIRRDQFQRSSNAKVDDTIPPSDHELANARAAIRVVLEWEIHSELRSEAGYLYSPNGAIKNHSVVNAALLREVEG